MKDIIKHAYYIVSLFSDNGKDINVIKLSYMSLLVEAHYMCKNDTIKELYEHNFTSNRMFRDTFY